MTDVDIRERSRHLHQRCRGKLGVSIRPEPDHNLPYLYTPGVAEVALDIKKEPALVHRYTSRDNFVAVVSDGSRVLGLGDIGPLPALPVMEAKAYLFKAIADIDAIPLCLATTDETKIVEAVVAIAPSFGAINLEDIASPKCFGIESELKAILEGGDNPTLVCHDDQHGTAVVVLAALLNALRCVEKHIDEVKTVFLGCGAAGYACFDLLTRAELDPAKTLVFNEGGLVCGDRTDLLEHERDVAARTKQAQTNDKKDFEEAARGVDVIIALSKSGSGMITEKTIRRMNKKPIVFALANPDPEINYDDAVQFGAFVAATGLPIYPNQINDIMSMPAIFRGALDVGASAITAGMLRAAAEAMAETVPDVPPKPDYILPRVGRVHLVSRVAAAVAEHACRSAEVEVRMPLPEGMEAELEYDNVMARLQPFR